MAEEDFYTMWGQWAEQTCKKLMKIKELAEENKKLRETISSLNKENTALFCDWSLGQESRTQLQRKNKFLKKENAELWNYKRNHVDLMFKESCYTLWLEEKAHERNLELARDRERLADGWLLEAACIEKFLREKKAQTLLS